jgi:hypothetical protein
MIEPLTTKQQDLIVKNVVAACKDIEKLNGTGYGFVYLASGFIAHYNINGFKAFYSDADLKRDILRNQKYNQWNNFTEKDSDYAYYMTKKSVYNRICEQLKGI